MNLLRLIVIAFSAIALASCGNLLGAKAAEMRSENSTQTFADWCRQKDSLSPETKNTVEVLLQQAETTECDAANQKLSSLTGLDLEENKISDIRPLQSLTNLTSLGLDHTQISDIKPL
jgi:internalin A